MANEIKLSIYSGTLIVHTPVGDVRIVVTEYPDGETKKKIVRLHMTGRNEHIWYSARYDGRVRFTVKPVGASMYEKPDE